MGREHRDALERMWKRDERMAWCMIGFVAVVYTTCALALAAGCL